jgi:hypothetical protein
MEAWPGQVTVLWSVDDAVAWALKLQRPEPPVWAQKQANAALSSPEVS